MSISVDGKVYKGDLEVFYGDEFIKRYRNYQVESSSRGKCNIYVTYVGEPYWSKRWSVMFPVEFYVTIIYGKRELEKENNHLKLVK